MVQESNSNFNGICCLHLDLKGLPPTEARLLSLLKLIAAAGYNALLVEWEDAFPWNVNPEFRSETAYSTEFVSGFHRAAHELGLEIIPLVQCLGHMETPLRLPQYARLREVSDRCDGLNPLAAGAPELVEQMIDDVLAQAYGSIRYFHLGGDEAWSFGSHLQTRAFIAEHGKAALFQHHVLTLCQKLKDRGIRPLIWHDMMHDWAEADLKKIAPHADVVAWGYQGHPDNARGHYRTEVIHRLHQAGMKLWGATAYKGADGAGDPDVPDLQARVANAHAWNELAGRFAMIGLIATGWSRYSTHRVQCEPIDGALDALVQVASILNSGEALTPQSCSQLLERAGELQRFEQCHAALALLATARKTAWQRVLIVREQLAVERIDPRRRGSGVLQTLLRIANQELAQTESAGRIVRAALQGMIRPIWLDRYLEERLAPLRDEMQLLSPAAT
jgi:hexosaminidase